MSARPIPCSPPTRLRCVSSATGSMRRPSTATGSPDSNSISTSTAISGAASGDCVSWNILSGGEAHGSSRIPPSYEMWNRFRSVLYGRSVVTGTGMSWRFANSTSAVRELRSHSRQGAIT